ncbi:MAG: glycosyltransferase [Adlercreutzia sp.]|nr:glycosyltransferase [Adlercreutzia sp.]
MLNIILPVYNEEGRLRKGVETTVNYLERSHQGEYELTIVDNASSDETSRIAESLCEDYPQVQYFRINEKGVGAAFRKGVDENESPIVGYMDIDLSTDVRHIDDVLRLFFSDGSIGMVNGSRWARGSDACGRKWYRNLTSHGLTWFLKIAVGMQATDSICGFKFFAKELAEKLVSEADASENGWFYIIELLLRAERSDCVVRELPVRWCDDSENSKVEVIPLIRNYCEQTARLRRVLKSEDAHKAIGG